MCPARPLFPLQPPALHNKRQPIACKCSETLQNKRSNAPKQNKANKKKTFSRHYLPFAKSIYLPTPPPLSNPQGLSCETSAPPDLSRAPVAVTRVHVALSGPLLRISWRLTVHLQHFAPEPDAVCRRTQGPNYPLRSTFFFFFFFFFFFSRVHIFCARAVVNKTDIRTLLFPLPLSLSLSLLPPFSLPTSYPPLPFLSSHFLPPPPPPISSPSLNIGSMFHTSTVNSERIVKQSFPTSVMVVDFTFYWPQDTTY